MGHLEASYQDIGIALNAFPPAPAPAGTLPNLCAPELPIYNSKSDIIEAITTHSAVVIISPTGTGKSTQVPKMAHEAGFDVVRQTQPRRRPTINVGKRILAELGAVLGEEKAAETVSWQTGSGLVGQRGTPIQLMTENVLLRKDAYRPTKGTNEMWVLDEAHERSKYLDILMGLAKQKRMSNPDFTLVSMSATPDKHGMISYLTDELGQEPAVIELIAPMYDVEYRERPKSDLMKEILHAARDIHANPDTYGGSNTIQVFESGVGEINDIIDELHTRLPAEILAKATILPNHSRLSHKLQERVYEPVEGIKIVVQTNIGKTSNTVAGTRYVITQGKERQPVLDEEAISSLVEIDISQDCMGQQRGRGGRTSPSVFVHTKREGQQYVPLNQRQPHLTPEIQRTSLDDTVLYLAFRGENIRTFDFMDDPEPKNVERAVRRMKALGAIDGAEHITEVGKKMFGFAASPEGQRSMVESLKYPQHIRLYMAALVAMTESGGLRQFMNHDADEQARDLTDEVSSDLLSCLEVFIEVRGKSLGDLNDMDVSIDNYLRVDELLRKLVASAGVTEITEMKVPSEAERDILRKCILVGYVNNLYVPHEKGKVKGKEKTLFQALGTSSLLREISNQSVVSGRTRRPIVGIPRTLQVYEKGKIVPRPIVEHVTTFSWQEVGKLGLDATEWVTANLRPRGDAFVAVEHQIIGNQVIDAREVPAEPSLRLRSAIIEQVKDVPGKNLLYLYKIKSETEGLAHKSKKPVRGLTQDMINSIIETVTPEDVTNPSHVEENLRQHIIENKISLESFVTEEERAAIIRNAPTKIQVGDVILKVHYRQGKPLVYVRNNIEIHSNLPDVVQLRDGRDVFFVYDDARLTSLQFKNKLRAQNLIRI